MGLLKHYSGVATEEDAEEWRIEQLGKIFQSSKLNDVRKHIGMDLRFAKEGQITELKKEYVVCGFCNTKNDILSAFPTSFTLQMHELANSTLQQLNHYKIREKIEKKAVDEFEGFKQLKAWEFTRKTGTSEVSGKLDIKCTGCEQLIGTLQYRFIMQNVPEFIAITWEQLDCLQKPSATILPRICKKMHVRIEDLDSYLSSEWVEKLKAKLQSWADELKTFKQLPPDLEYNIAQFLGLTSINIEKEKQHRFAEWHESLLAIVKEELAYLGSVK